MGRLTMSGSTGVRELWEVSFGDVEAGGEDLAGERRRGRPVADVPGHRLVEKDREVDVRGVDDLDVMRIGARNEVDVALLEVVGVQ